MRQWLAAGAIGLAAWYGLGSNQPPNQSLTLDQSSEREALEITAAHEAGHAVAARALGIPVLSSELLGGHRGLTTYPDNYFHDPVKDGRSYAVVDVAGQESAAEWLVQHNGRAREQALAETAGPAQSDLSQLSADSARGGISEDDARGRARDIIHSQWLRVDQTAQRLVNAYDHGRPLRERDFER